MVYSTTPANSRLINYISSLAHSDSTAAQNALLTLNRIAMLSIPSSQVATVFRRCFSACELIIGVLLLARRIFRNDAALPAPSLQNATLWPWHGAAAVLCPAVLSLFGYRALASAPRLTLLRLLQPLCGLLLLRLSTTTRASRAT